MAPLNADPNVFRAALLVFDACAAEGASLSLLNDGGLHLDHESPSEALRARVTSFCGQHEGRERSQPYRALRAVVAAPSRAARELLTVRVAYLTLGLPYTFTFTRKGAVAACTNSRASYETEQGTRPVFVFRELEAAAMAVELGRASPMHLDGWLGAKRQGQPWVLSPELAGADLASMPELEARPLHERKQAPEPPTLTVGELLDALGAELGDVVLHEPKEAA